MPAARAYCLTSWRMRGVEYDRCRFEFKEIPRVFGALGRTHEKVLDEFFMGVHGFEVRIVSCHNPPSDNNSNRFPTFTRTGSLALAIEMCAAVAGDSSALTPGSKGKTAILTAHTFRHSVSRCYAKVHQLWVLLAPTEIRGTLMEFITLVERARQGRCDGVQSPGGRSTGASSIFDCLSTLGHAAEARTCTQEVFRPVSTT